MYLKLFVFISIYLNYSNAFSNESSNSQLKENRVIVAKLGEMNTIDKTVFIFNELRKDNLEILNGFYSKSMVFEDPLGRIEGLDSMKKYYAVMYENVTEIKFDFLKSVKQGNDHFFRWKMTMKASKLNGGDPVVVEGGSLITFNDEGLVVYHRDFFDMGEMIYEQIPILRSIIKSIKGRFSH